MASISRNFWFFRITGFLDFVHRRELDILEGREMSTLLGPLERTNRSYWNSGPSSPVILSVVHRRQNPKLTTDARVSVAR
jgi:hypothetical protein